MRAHFEGKTIELYIGYAAGGGYDIRGRIFAEFFPKYMPGNPKVAVVNLPGAGGLQATREVMRSRPDGLKMVIVPAGIYINELLGDDQEGFEVTQPLKLGNYEIVADDYTTLQVRSEVGSTWEEIAAAGRSGKKFKYGAPAVGNSQALAGEWLAAVGAPIEVVYGYGGTNEVLAALDRKEIDMYATDGPAATKQASFIRIQQGFPEWLTQNPKYVTPILSTRTKAPEAWFGHFDFKAPPHILEAVESNQLQKDAYTLAHKVREGVDPLALPPNTPADIYQTMRDAMKQAAEDPGFREAMEQRGFVGGYRSPEELDEGLTALGRAPKEVVDVVRRMYTGK
jgi:tripartite-type tricarboxylate transporter receptor subunit TctC